MSPEIPVLDKGFVRLDGYMADDLSVVNGARVSFAKRKEVVESDDVALIHFLMRDRHGSPFEHNAFRFHIKAPIFVAREWFRHRIGSFNEWSGRYSKLEPDFYIPDHVRGQTGKPGHYKFEVVSDLDVTADFRQDLDESSKRAFEQYEIALGLGIAKEQARLFLPVNIYTQWYWTVNARSLMNFLSLRNDDRAMFEIREYAKVVEDLASEKMPHTFAAFVENRRVAP